VKIFYGGVLYNEENTLLTSYKKEYGENTLATGIFISYFYRNH